MDREAELQITIDRLALELAREQAAHRRTVEDLLLAEERLRVYRRVIERLGQGLPVSWPTRRDQ